LKPFAGGLSSKGAGGGKSKGAGKSKKTVHIVEEGQEEEAEEEWPEEEEQEDEQTVQRIEGDTSTVWMF
jgi:midasin (ATPase involved in ribosome maturation)